MHLNNKLVVPVSRDKLHRKLRPQPTLTRIYPMNTSPASLARRSIAPFLLVASLLSAASCSSDTSAAPGWTTSSDTSATGIVRVVNSPPEAGINPTWSLDPEMRIGAVDGEGPDVFGQIKGIAPLADGGVAVLDAQA